MNEVIVRMEMPKSCDLCPCLDDYGDYPMCRITGEQRGYTFNIREKRMPDCPIVCALPENHGDLIDRDAFLRTVRPASKDDDAKACTFTTVKRLITDHIKVQKTIVPAAETEAAPCP